MKLIFHILTAVLAALLHSQSAPADRGGTARDLTAWTISQTTGCYDTGPRRGAELSADTELGASADGPDGPCGVPASVRQVHAWERDEEIRQSYHRMADAPAKWSLPPPTGPPSS